MAILYCHGEKISYEARPDDDGAAVPGIVRGRAEVRRAAKPAALAGGFPMPSLRRAEPWVHGRATSA
jgi:hypothetical protein